MNLRTFLEQQELKSFPYSDYICHIVNLNETPIQTVKIKVNSPNKEKSESKDDNTLKKPINSKLSTESPVKKAANLLVEEELRKNPDNTVIAFKKAADLIYDNCEKEIVDTVLRLKRVENQLNKNLNNEIKPKTQVQTQHKTPSKTPKNLAENYHIEIHNDGKTTQCSLYYNDNLVRRTYAKLDPEDKFNLATGAKIALERMFPSKKKGEK